MSANRKVVVIVILGVGACLLSFIFSQYFLEKEHGNQLVLSQIQQASARIVNIRFLGKSFIKNADEATWRQIMSSMVAVRQNLSVPPRAGGKWIQQIESLKSSLDDYHSFLIQLYEPAVKLQEEKQALQGMGLSFSKEIEGKIIRPYREEEGRRIYEGASIDPFKTRVKDTAADLNALHVKQQLLLVELLLTGDLEAYKGKKEELSAALEKHKAQLQYMNVLIGNDPYMQSTMASLDEKQMNLVRHEMAIVEYFTTLSELEKHLTDAGEKLLAVSDELSARIISDTERTTRLNRIMNWSLILAILAVLGILGTMLARDIIQFVENLNQTQTELQKSRNNLAVTLNSIGDAVISTDAEGMVARMNREAERLTGWSRDEAEGQPLDRVFNIINEHTREPLESPAHKVMALKQVIGLSNHTILVSKNGVEYPISDSAAPIYASPDDIIGIVMVFRDSTEKRNAAKALQESEKKYRTLFNDAPIMDIITQIQDDVPIIIEANNTFLESMGLSREDVIGKSLLDLCTIESRNEYLESFSQHPIVRALETGLVNHDGEVVNTLLYARPEEGSVGEGSKHRLLYLNITDLKRAEEETRQLEKKLIHAQKMEAIGTLAGGIAHDFNNILSAVIGYSQLALTEAPKDTRLHNNLEQILVAGMRASDLVRQILTFSRRGDQELNPIQIGPLVKEALKMLRSSLPTTIEIVSKVDSDIDNVMADPIQIHQIIMNLCTNAAQAMEDDGGQLTVDLSQVRLDSSDIRLHPGLKKGEYIRLSVEDTGQGIPEEIMENIYNPYFTTKEKGKGTGLGLSVVHGIVQSYNGAVYAYSEKGQGATFKVYLPAIKSESFIETQAVFAPLTGTEHILLVDDEQILIDVGRQMLEKLGYRVSTADGSIEALQLFTKTPNAYDLVLTDMTMPKMTGDKLAVELMKIRPDIPVVLSTGYSQKMTEEIASELGIKAFIHKPIVEADLAKTLRSVLDKSRIM
jgi:PAS domain S-box-containing protein